MRNCLQAQRSVSVRRHEVERIGMVPDAVRYIEEGGEIDVETPVLVMHTEALVGSLHESLLRGLVCPEG